MDMQYPEQAWVQPLLMHPVVLEQAWDDIPVADQMQYPVVEWVPAPAPHQMNVEESGWPHLSLSTHSLDWKAQSLSFVSLPDMGFASVYDGLQVVCISSSTFALLFPLLARHVESTGGDVDYGEDEIG